MTKSLLFHKLILLILLTYLTVLVNDNWGAFGAWSSCSVTCGGGIRSRTRLCNNSSPSDGGQPCVGSSTQTERCNVQNCPGK